MRPTLFSRMTRLLVPAAILSLTLATQGAAQTLEGSFDRTLKVTGAVELSVRGGSGRIHVAPGPADSVRIVGHIRAHPGSAWLDVGRWLQGRDLEQQIREIERNPPVEQQGNLIRVGSFADDTLLRGVSISYDVTVPSDTKLDAQTGSGGIEVGEIKGPVEATSGSGGISVGRIAGAVVASAGSGGIDVDGAASLDAHTGSGSIRATAVAGSITAKSGSGGITISQTGAGSVDVSASSGHVTLDGVDGAARVSCSSGSVSIDGRPSRPWSIETSSGSVTLGLPADASFDLDASSNSGTIDSAHPVTTTGRIERRRLQGRIRGGGPLVEIRSSSGGIRIR